MKSSKVLFFTGAAFPNGSKYEAYDIIILEEVGRVASSLDIKVQNKDLVREVDSDFIGDDFDRAGPGNFSTFVSKENLEKVFICNYKAEIFYSDHPLQRVEYKAPISGDLNLN